MFAPRHSRPGPGEWQPGMSENGAGRFLEVYLDLTNQCNLRCVMCQTPHAPGMPTQQLGWDVYESLAQALFPSTANAVLSCLHEPLMVRGFFDFLKRVEDFGVPQITITTNALFMRPKMCHKIMESGLTDIHVSVDGASAEVYESIRLGAKMSTLLSNLAAFCEIRGEQALPRLQIQAVVMPENYHEIPLFVKNFARFRPRRILFIHKDLKPPEASQRAFVERQLNKALQACIAEGIIFEEYPGLFVSARQVLSAFGATDAEEQPEAGCTDPFRFIRIQPDGDVFFCSGARTPAGNLFRENITEIWNGSRAYRMRHAWQLGRPPPECATCSLPLKGTTRLMQLRRHVDETLAPIVGRVQPLVGQDQPRAH